MATIIQTTSNPTSFTPKRSKGQILVDWLTTTDHKKIGYLYLITSFLYFLIGGVMALIIRAQLALPGLDVVATKEQYNQLFTMHGTIMLLMFATPLFAQKALAYWSRLFHFTRPDDLMTMIFERFYDLIFIIIIT
ncbi:MAG: cbb3-type cytochrome c oxidase subunit I, partial [Aquiluna sp.]